MTNPHIDSVLDTMEAWHKSRKLSEVRVGNVYKSRATGPKGWKAGTRYWLVVAVCREKRNHCGGVHMLGLDKDWNIVSTTSYSIWTMEERPLLFRIKNVEQFALTIQENRDEH